MGASFSSSSSSSSSSAASSYFCCTYTRGGGRHGAYTLPREKENDLGHTFCYAPSPHNSSQPAEHEQQQVPHSFSVISGASLSANANASGCAVESSSSFSALPLRRSYANSGRGFFLSGPIEREGTASWSGFRGSFSAPVGTMKKQRSSGKSAFGNYRLRRAASLSSRLPSVVPERYVGSKRKFDRRDVMVGCCGVGDGGGSMQWMCGKAGEDRVHVVLSEEHRWMFVGIYDGFNGPDAPEFLVRNLYRSVFKRLNERLPEGTQEKKHGAVSVDNGVKRTGSRNERPLKESVVNIDGASGEVAKPQSSQADGTSGNNGRRNHDSKENVDERCLSRTEKACGAVDHGLVLAALSGALEMVELEYLELTDAAMNHKPELALMGSCTLAVLVMGEDVYVLNLGDSRAIVGQYRHAGVDDEEGSNSTNYGVDAMEGIAEQVDVAESARPTPSTELAALQLSVEHSTGNPEEVQRILEEHPDDSRCIINERIKGRLKVTRAFGVGYLKQPKWNNGLLKMFRNEYVGTRPYISCSPSLHHHKLGPKDRFLVLSSDGLYQYLTNEEVVSHVGSYMEKFPDGDPAQSLVEELLLRAAKTAGMNFHELLEIPHGERRKFHDDVIVMVVSVEGRIWKSSG